MKLSFTKVYPYGPTAYTYWFSGVYKIVQYNSEEFYAYVIEPGMSNWGNHVAKPPRTNTVRGMVLNYWPTFMSAVEACKKHYAINGDATIDTLKRANEIFKQEADKAQTNRATL